MVFKSQELWARGNDSTQQGWATPEILAWSQLCKKSGNLWGLQSRLQGAETTGNSRSLISELRSWVPRHFAGAQCRTDMGLITSRLLIPVHAQEPHVKLAETFGPFWLSICSAPPCLCSRIPGPFHPSQRTLIILKFPPALRLTGSAANGRWAALCFHRKAPGGDPHVSMSSVRDPRPDSFLPPG